MEPFAAGAFGEVFHLGAGRILKAFYATPSARPPNGDATLIPRIAFAAEKALYEGLAEEPRLERYLPEYFGAADPLQYPLRSKRTMVAGCGLILEFIPGRALKFSELPKDVERRVSAIIGEIGEMFPLAYPWDGSAFIPGSRAPFALIDIATPTDKFVLLDELVKHHGDVPVHQYRRLGIQY
jgi:hypothetical protein